MLSGVTYQWMGPAGFNSNLAITQTSLAGNYVLTVTGLNGCTVTTVTTVLQDTMPPDAQITGETLLDCNQTTAGLTALSVAGTAWVWGGPGNFSANTTSVDVSQQGDYIVTITAPNGCTNTANWMVLQDTISPSIQVLGGTLTCSAPSLALVVSSSDPLTQYAWSGPGGFSSIIAAPQVNLAGVYAVLATAGNGCTASASLVVPADQQAPVFSVSGDTITCADPISTAIANGLDVGTALQWTGPGGFQQNGIEVSISQPGVYQATATGTNGCTAVQSLAVPTDTMAPIVVLTGDVITCRDSLAQITAQVQPAGGTLVWAGPQPGLPADLVVTVMLPGLYQITVTGPNGCTQTAETLVEIIEPSWTVDLGPDLVFWEGNWVMLDLNTDLPKAQLQSIEWTPVFSCSNCMSQYWRAQETVTVQVTLEDKNGCLMSDQVLVEVRKRGSLYIPNIFSPNADGRDDEFEIFSSNPNLRIQHFRVYDRWGSLVFEALDFAPGDQSGRWDGRFKGQDVQPGVYVWTAIVAFEDGAKELLKGDVTIVR
ncbi:MAG: gliding motility-associated C-terminal domain-containing protein [Lewinellaceae bacterium]|nr:gliding motility-associated C-terminal domain-containing protein [Lewinellaceae bacterium]